MEPMPNELMDHMQEFFGQLSETPDPSKGFGSDPSEDSGPGSRLGSASQACAAKLTPKILFTPVLHGFSWLLACMIQRSIARINKIRMCDQISCKVN